ncbi:hypothetical protein O6H91_02G046000 [Diphasiastrum complanatum]|uniref:Uncharacterized protein n=1 Tax=Diphasiastrum complanatum TaxID=34168 RepID=A0ACC2EEU2_DIPCM|nr:hypothetical protein O6H91_02G046000 [Diphasiastrum complanatum]
MGGCNSSSRKIPKKHNQRIRYLRPRKDCAKFNTHFPGLPVADVYDVPTFQSDVKVESFDASKYICLDGDTLVEIKRKAATRRSREDTWFDAEMRLGSDSEEEYLSVYDDLVSSAGNTLSLPRSLPGTPRPTFAALKERLQKLEATQDLLESVGHSESHETAVSLVSSKMYDAKPSRRTLHLLFAETADEAQQQKDSTPTILSDVTNLKNVSDAFHKTSVVSVTPVMDDGHSSMEDRKFDQHTYERFCLPCLMSGIISNEKKRSASPHSSLQRKKTSRWFSFKRRPSFDSNDGLPSQVSKVSIKVPRAGTQVPCSSNECKEGCWSTLSPSTFKLRAPNYMKDRKKQYAPPQAIYDVVGVDVFLASKKINHIAQFVDLPYQDLPVDSDDLPLLLIFNIQVPLYPASIFSSNTDGEGFSLVIYFKLSEAFKKEIPICLKEMLKNFLDDNKDRVKGLVGDFISPFRDRLKIIARVCNPEQIHLSATEKKLVGTYNEKPVLSRPQHAFYRGRNYFEVDLDVHRFSFIARKTVESFRERLKLCILDIGLIIQGNKQEELPEHILCCFRLEKLDIRSFRYLSV